jgi:hypothetical protein
MIIIFSCCNNMKILWSGFPCLCQIIKFLSEPLWLSGYVFRHELPNYIQCSNLGAIRHEMTLNNSLTAVCLGSSGRCVLIMCDVYWPLWVVSAYEKLSRGALCQGGLLSRAIVRNSCRKNIGLSKLSPDSTLYHKGGFE